MSMLLVALLAVLGFGLPLALSVQALYRDEALLTLSEEAARSAVAVPVAYARSNDLPELPTPVSGVAVALYSANQMRVVGVGPPRADEAVTRVLGGAQVQRDRRHLVVVLPITDHETVVGAIRSSLPEQSIAKRTHRAWGAMAALAAVVLLAAGLLATERSRRLTRPMLLLRGDAEVIGAGGEVPARPQTGVTEIDAVHAALGQAAARLNAALARERAFGADVAHQLRTPLTSLRLRLETEQLQGSGASAMVEESLVDVERLQQTVNDLLVLARDTDVVRTPHALGSLLADAVMRWETLVHGHGRRLVLRAEPQLPWISVSTSAVRQILDVLLENALVHGSGQIVLSGTRVSVGAVVAVTDQGAAVIDPAEVFTRYNLRAAGSGIGLALAKRVADAEGMQLVVAHPGPAPVFHLIVAR